MRENINNCKYCGHKIRKVNGVYPDAKYHKKCEKEAKDFITRLYSYETESALFKPTLASDFQFRLDKISALSYFVGSNQDFPEDQGFAIKEWNKVSWENVGIKIMEDCVYTR